jgi:hypothetical protein
VGYRNFFVSDFKELCSPDLAASHKEKCRFEIEDCGMLSLFLDVILAELADCGCQQMMGNKPSTFMNGKLLLAPGDII